MTVIYIEVLILFIVIAIFGIWFVWVKLSKKYHNWRYKPENDRGKIGEDHRKELLKKGKPDPVRGVQRSITTDPSRIELPERQGESEGHSDIPATESNSTGKNRFGLRESIRNPFKRRK